MFGMLPVCAALMFGIARIKEKHSRQVMEAKTMRLHKSMKSSWYERSEGISSYRRRISCFGNGHAEIADESLKEEAVAGSLSTLCSSLVKFIVPITAAVGFIC